MFLWVSSWCHYTSSTFAPETLLQATRLMLDSFDGLMDFTIESPTIKTSLFESLMLLTFLYILPIVKREWLLENDPRRLYLSFRVMVEWWWRSLVTEDVIQGCGSRDAKFKKNLCVRFSWLGVCSRHDFFLRVSQIRKFGITKIYVCRALANPAVIAIYRLTRYRYFAPVLSAYAFRNLRYFIQTIATDHAILWSFPVLRFTR